MSVHVLMAGASGLVGGELLQLLLKDGNVSGVSSVGRRSLEIHAPKLDQIQADFADIGDLPEAQIAFCTLGTTIKKAGSREAFRLVDHTYIVNFATAAQLAGVRHFLLVSALGAEPTSRIFYNQVKGETEAVVKTLGFERVTILRPSLLLGKRKETRFAERLLVDLYPLYGPLLIGPLAKSRPIEARRVAKAMLEKAFATGPKTEVVLNYEML